MAPPNGAEINNQCDAQLQTSPLSKDTRNLSIFKLLNGEVVRTTSIGLPFKSVTDKKTRHRASTSMQMNSLTFRVRVMFAIATEPVHRSDCKSAKYCTTRGHPLPLPKLHPGPCNSVGMRPRTDTDTQTRVCDHNTFLVVYDSHEM